MSSKLSQEGEATPDPDGVPWDTEQDEAEGEKRRMKVMTTRRFMMSLSLMLTTGLIQKLRWSSTQVLKWMLRAMVMVVIRRGKRV